jgi:tRNA A-37 threonylcarbamoyl transferase component Bud32/tetratricopeptide (TPR) repeat protein
MIDPKENLPKDETPREQTAAYLSAGSTSECDSAASVSTVDDGQARTASAKAKAAVGRFGDYELLELIAHGGMGVVYKARHLKLNRIVALKMILAGRLASPETIRRFHTEAQAAARLDHPGIVPIYEVGEQDGQPFLALAFIDGGSLAARVKEGPLPPREAADLVRQIAEAVACAHAAGIIHRDLKPGNILLMLPADSTAAKPKVADFGLAKLATEPGTEQTQTGQVMGTPSFMPPEQASGRTAEIGPAADIYALGAILYCLLTGRPPFQAASTVETLRLVMEREPVAPRLLNPGVPRDLETICGKCLQKEPRKRYESAAGLAADLQRYLDGRPIIARPAGAMERATKWIRRNPLAASLIAALTLGLIGTTAAGLAAVRQRDRAIIAERDKTAEQRQRLIDTHLASARLAMQRGAWNDALTAFERAEADGFTLTVPLRLDRVRCHVFLAQAAAAQRQLDELASRSDLGEEAALVALFRGDLMMGVDSAQGEQLLQRALAGKLPAAEIWYARGLISRKTGEALDYFRKAVEADRFHREARGFVGLLLLLLGRHDEARDWLAQTELLFPDDPQVQLLLAMCHEQRLDAAAAAPHWQHAASAVPADDIKLLRSLIGLLPKLRPILEQSAGIADKADVAKSFVAVMAFNQLRSSSGRIARLAEPVRDEAGLIRQAPILRLPLALEPLRRFLTKVSSDVDAARSGRDPTAELIRDERKLADFAQLVDDTGEGLSRYYYGQILFERAMAHLSGSRENQALFVPRMREAARAFDQARRMPGFVDARALALHQYIVAVAMLGEPTRPQSDPETRANAAREIREFMRHGKIPMPLRDIYLKAARNAGDWNLVREIIDDWDRQSPNRPEALRARAKYELLAGAPGSAAVAARDCLKQNPSDVEATKLLREALDKLKSLFPELAQAK